MAGERPAHQPDDYITGSTNINHLTSSVGLFTRADNYVTLLDTNILCSPEGHLRGCELQEVDADYIWRLFVFGSYLSRSLDDKQQILLLPGVVTEMLHLTGACRAATRAQLSAFEALATPAERNQVAKQRQALQKYLGALEKLEASLERRQGREHHAVPEVYTHLLEVVKILDRNLGLKKASSVEGRDVDERIVAEAFYQVLVEHHNCAVYSRDDDLRHLITMTFRFLVAGDLFQPERFSALQGLRYKNLVLMTFDLEKGTYNRIFESLTTQFSERFHFPRQTPERARTTVLDRGVREVTDLNACFERALAHVQAEPTEADAGKPARPATGLVQAAPGRSSVRTPTAAASRARRQPSAGRVTKALRSLYDHAKLVETEEMTVEEHIEYFEALRVVSQASGEKDVLDLCERKLGELRGQQLGQVVTELEKRIAGVQEQLTALVSLATSGGEVNVDFTRRVAQLNEELQGLLLERRFFNRAREKGLAGCGPEHFLRFRELLGGFEALGYELGTQPTGVPVEDIVELTGLVHLEVIRVVTAHSLRHEANTVFLTVDDVAAFVL